MKDSDLVFKHGDAQSAEHALQNHRAEGKRAEVANPSPRFAAPKPDREDDRQKPNCRSNQAVGVLKKNSADPFRSGKQKHVVAKGGWPIGHREAHPFAGDHSAAANEEQSRNACEPRKTVERRWRSFWRRLDCCFFANHKPINRGLRG